MIDRTLAILSLAGLIIFLGVVILYVPDPDLVIVMTLVFAMAAYDFYATAFRNRKKNNG
jgi:hypothetical protein